MYTGKKATFSTCARRLQFVGILLLAGTLAACGDDRPEPPRAAEAPDTGAATNPALTSGGSDGAVAADTAAPPPRGVEATGFLIAVDGEGLRAFDAVTGAARPIPFGGSFEDTVNGVTGITSAVPPERGETPDCGLAYASWENGLTITGRGGRFVGWSLRPSSTEAVLTTASGVGIGSIRSRVDSVYDIEVAESSLGVEFSAGGMAGIFDEDGPEGRVTAIWAGEVCIAR